MNRFIKNSAAVLFGFFFFSSIFAGFSFALQRIITIHARKFAFEPSKIQVCTQTHYTLRITSDDTRHGFQIKKLNIKVEIPAKRTVDVPLYIEKPGTYFFSCSVYCGRGHKNMIGRIEAKQCSRKEEEP